MIRRHLLAGSVTFVLLAVVTVGVTALANAQQRDTADRLGLVATSLAQSLDSELTRISDLGLDIAIALRETGPVDHSGYVALLDTFDLDARYPALVGISYIQVVRRDELGNWLAAREAEPDAFALHEDAGEDLLRIIRSSYPLPRNAAAVGVDLTDRLESREVIDRALATGQPNLSQATQIVQLPEGESGAVLHLPLYPGGPPPGTPPSTLGLVLSGPAVVEAIDPLPADVHVRLLDPSSAPFPLIGEIGTAVAHGRYSELVERRPVTADPPGWVVEVRPGPGFGPSGPFQPAIVFGLAGVSIALLAGAVIAAVSSRERLASSLAAERTAELAHSNELLASTNRKLTTTNDDLRRANRSKDEFLAAVSHELRTPLTVISGFTEAMGRLPQGESRDALLVPLERNVRRLDSLVEDLLTLAGLDADALTAFVEPVLLEQAVARSTRQVSWLDGLDIEVAIEPDVHVQADPRHLQRMLACLIANAVQHGAPPITISAVIHDDVVDLRVRDHGSGIGSEDTDRLFRRFERGFDVDRSTGTGLGLSIVKGLAVLNGGSVRYEAAEPGACFVVRLSRASDPAPAEVADSPGRRDTDAIDGADHRGRQNSHG